MILIIKNKDAVIQQAVQLLPRDLVSFSNDQHCGVKVHASKWSWSVTGAVILTTDCGKQIGYHSYKELVNKSSIPLIKPITLMAYDTPVVGYTGRKLELWSIHENFEPKVYNTENLTDDQIMWEGTPVIIVASGDRFITVSTDERFNNKDPMVVSNEYGSRISFWGMPERSEENGKSITYFIMVNIIRNPEVRELLGPPIPNFVAAIEMLTKDILHGTREHIKQVCEESLDTL